MTKKDGIAEWLNTLTKEEKELVQTTTPAERLRLIDIHNKLSTEGETSYGASNPVFELGMKHNYDVPSIVRNIAYLLVQENIELEDFLAMNCAPFLNNSSLPN
jgi:hypothetical protein